MPPKGGVPTEPERRLSGVALLRAVVRSGGRQSSAASLCWRVKAAFRQNRNAAFTRQEADPWMSCLAP